ncbi:hypothetical protein H8959_017763 [Pygathrix nigripes]
MPEQRGRRPGEPLGVLLERPGEPLGVLLDGLGELLGTLLEGPGELLGTLLEQPGEPPGCIAGAAVRATLVRVAGAEGAAAVRRRSCSSCHPRWNIHLCSRRAELGWPRPPALDASCSVILLSKTVPLLAVAGWLVSIKDTRGWADVESVSFGSRLRVQTSALCSVAETGTHVVSCDITQKGYEKKRSKLIGAYLPQPPTANGAAVVRCRLQHSEGAPRRTFRSAHIGVCDVREAAARERVASTAGNRPLFYFRFGVDQALPQERRAPVTPSSASRYHRRRSSGSRDERYRSDVHTEAVQAALAKHKERKMAVPMPSKRRSLVVQTSMDAYTPPDTSSGSEDEGSVQGDSQGTPTSSQGSINMEHWISQAIHGSTTSTTSSSSTQSGGSGAAHRLADVMAQTHIENHSAPPDVTTYTSEHSIQVERPQGSTGSRTAPKYGNAELMETGDGVPVSSRVSAKIQQLVNTLKRPKRPPLREFFVDDFEELLEVQQPDPNQPKPEGAQMLAMRGEQLGVVTNWPPSLEAALQRWGTISPKAPCLTTMDTNGKPLYILTYGKLWTRSMKVAYSILHKLGTKQEPMVRPGDRVALVFPNNDPAAFMAAFYGCLLAEVVPVPIEVPLTRKDAGSQQIGFLLGSCGVTVALTSDACHKGLPKSPTGEIPQFKGWPKLLWFVTESKHLSKPPRDWFPHIKDANNDTAYIEYKTCKDGSVLGVTVTRTALLTHCQALTQACGYTEAETIVNVLDFKKDVGLWHGILTDYTQTRLGHAHADQLSPPSPPSGACRVLCDCSSSGPVQPGVCGASCERLLLFFPCSSGAACGLVSTALTESLLLCHAPL